MGASLQCDYLPSRFSPETAGVVGGAGEDKYVTPEKKAFIEGTGRCLQKLPQDCSNTFSLNPFVVPSVVLSCDLTTPHKTAEGTNEYNYYVKMQTKTSKGEGAGACTQNLEELGLVGKPCLCQHLPRTAGGPCH